MVMKTLALLAAAALLPSCTMAQGDGLALGGTAWTVTRIDGAAPVSPDKAKLTFEADRIGANVGCNGMGGEYRIEGGRLIAGPLMATRMFCEGPVWDQEQAVGALLAGAPKIGRNGDTLRLESSGHSLEAVRAK
jgi:heat shock protein HslJ